MRGNKENHEAMWQYIIDHVDDIFKLYTDTKEEEDPEWIVAKEKGEFIRTHCDEIYVIHKCYACHQCKGECSKCPIVLKAGNCRNEDDAAYNMVLKAIFNNDKELFIKEAGRLRDAW